MKPFHSGSFAAMHSLIASLREQINSKLNEEALNTVSRDMQIPMGKILEMYFSQSLADLDIPLTRVAVNRLCSEISRDECTWTVSEVWSQVDGVFERLLDEVDSRGSFFYIPLSRAQYFSREEAFGKVVSKKFPRLTEDIQDACKCYACGRYTACVFHLMRVMEYGLQRLGKKLGVPNVEIEVWQKILDQVNSEIKKLPHKHLRTVKLAQIAGHLYNVKLAWRNEVMHPKSTYTEEEAENLLKQVGIFMDGLAKVV